MAFEVSSGGASRWSVTLYSQAYARHRSRSASPPPGYDRCRNPPAISPSCPVRASVRSQPMGTLHVGVRRVRSSKLAADEVVIGSQQLVHLVGNARARQGETDAGNDAQHRADRRNLADH